MQPIVLQYDEDLVRSAVKAFWLKTLGWPYFAALALVGSGIGIDVLAGGHSWLLGVFGTVLVLGLGFAVVQSHSCRWKGLLKQG